MGFFLHFFIQVGWMMRYPKLGYRYFESSTEEGFSPSSYQHTTLLPPVSFRLEKVKAGSSAITFTDESTQT